MAELNLSGKLLIAMPGMGDQRFGHSVVLLCSHSEEGAMGLIVNKPSADVTFADLLKQLEIGTPDSGADLPVHFGGPVEGARGFVLHSRDYQSNLRTLEVGEEFGLTATLDILEDIAAGKGPSRVLMALGYSGWGPMQLESEIAANGWLTADADADLVFGSDNSGKWTAALKSLGVDPTGLSASAGHA